MSWYALQALVSRRLWIWLPALLFFALNLTLFSAYRLVYAGQVDLLEAQIQRSERELRDLEGRSNRLAIALGDALEARDQVRELYQTGFSTERQRLTRILEEVKDLARRAGLEPDAISYPEEEIEDFGLINKAFVFNVEGSYMDLRKLINFLELTESFLTLEEIRLAETEGRRGQLRISLRLSTLFAEEEM